MSRPSFPHCFIFLFLSVCFASLAFAAKKTCNVLEYGAKADNRTDIGPPLMKAFSDCLTATTGHAKDTVIRIPKGDYSLQTNVFFRSGKALTFRFEGNLHLAFNPELKNSMITFHQCQNIIMRGKGTFFGYGDLWRPNRNLTLFPYRPRLVRFQDCQDVKYSGFNLYDAPMFHLVVANGTNVEIHNFRINCTTIGTTDGVDVSGKNIHVHDLVVQTGDECVTAKSPLDGLLVENIQCITTDGCAIGSFGREAKDYSIQNILYRNVSLTNASHGMVLKSYASATGIVRNITYTDFTLENVSYPIKFDYTWGDTLRPHKRAEGVQQWADATFVNFKGTGSDSRSLVTLNCPPSSPCYNFQFKNVQLTGSPMRPTISAACGSFDAASNITFQGSLPACDPAARPQFLTSS